MPIYDYRCIDCGSIYDIYHKGKECPEDIVCPSCGSRNYTKLISVPSIISRGSSAIIERCTESCKRENACCDSVCELNK
jgi:putative FmdB family regulatory protein